jgi:hypothetical protein
LEAETDPLALRRYENKFLLDGLEAAAIESWLAGTPGCVRESPRRITTIYLDDANEALCRRLLGARGARSRLRLRSYGDASDPLVLERKYEVAGMVRKSRLLCRPAGLPGLLGGSDPRAARLGFGRLVRAPVAVCVVAYERQVFRDAAGSFRFTIDRAMGAEVLPPHWLERLETGWLPDVQPADDAPLVVESKHLGSSPRWLEEALAPHVAPRFSKLAWAYGRLRGALQMQASW